MLKASIPITNPYLSNSEPDTESDDFSVYRARSSSKKVKRIRTCRRKSRKGKNVVGFAGSRRDFVVSSNHTDSEEENDGSDEDTRLPRSVKRSHYLMRRALVYQRFMKELKIPDKGEELVTSCDTWVGLGKALEEKYKQPLHYLTSVELKKWDQASDGIPLDPGSGEVLVRVEEEAHRRDTSHRSLAKCWKKDKRYYQFLPPIPPELQPKTL